MGVLDQPLTLKMIIKIIFTIGSVCSIWKCFWSGFWYAYDWKEYKKAFAYFIVLLLNIIFIWWLWN